MGVDTKGFIDTSNKDVLLVTSLVTQALNRLIVTERRIMFPEPKLARSKEAREQFQPPTVTLLPDLEMANVDFVFNGEKRSLKLHFTCDSDQKEYCPKSLSLRVGCWGYGDVHVKTVLHALSLLGPAWFDANDSDDIDIAPLGERAPTLLGAVNLGYVRASSVSDWVERWDTGTIGRGLSFDEFFGAPEAKIRELVGMEDYVAGWKLLEAIAETLDETPKFLSDYHCEAMARSAP